METRRPRSMADTVAERGAACNASSVTGCSTSGRSRRRRRRCAPPTRRWPGSSSATGSRPSGPGSRASRRSSCSSSSSRSRSPRRARPSTASSAGSAWSTPAASCSSSDVELRADGFSRQKAGYVRALAAAVDEGTVDLDRIGALPDDDVRRALTALPGIGPWTAEVYLLSALRRPGHLAGGRHRAAGGDPPGPRPRGAPVAARARGDRRALAPTPRHRRAPPVAPLPERARRGPPARAPPP